MTDLDEGKILLTGATGYVGGRLLRRLEAAGYPVRCLARNPDHLRGRTGPGTETVRGDVLDPASLPRAMEGVGTAFYLIHSMGSGSGFEEQERSGARHFAEAARAAGVGRIIYLGGLVRSEEGLSPHLRSRVKVGEILAASGIRVIEFRASIIIGSGSLSFEIIRALVERLPVMVTPRWVGMEAQPIAIDDVLDYLMEAVSIDIPASRVFECGGADRVSYGGIMKEYARQRGLRRIMIPVPVITPRLSGLWLGLVTPVYARIGRKLIDSIRHASVVTDDTARRVFRVKPRGLKEAIASALRREDARFARTRWCDAISSAGAPASYGGRRFGTRYVDSREIAVPVPPGDAFVPIRRIGGTGGWYAYDGLWRLRGLIDLLAGGVGMRRGRAHPDTLKPGDTLDCWRVEECREGRLLRLRAEMRMPGRAWLQFEVNPAGEGATVRQTAIFDPIDLSGILYWKALFPLHELVFGGMLRAIGARLGSASRVRRVGGVTASHGAEVP